MRASVIAPIQSLARSAQDQIPSGSDKMLPFLPPLRLTGAQVLRQAGLQRRSLAIARGRITKGPLPEVDLSGYLILPGIIDLHFKAPLIAQAQELELVQTALVASGITTAWLTVDWPGERHSTGGAKRLELLQNLLQTRSKGPDLRAKLVVPPGSKIAHEVLAGFEAAGLDFASFLAEPRPRPRLLDPGSGDSGTQSQPYPRDLCQLAESFDRLGILYGSLGDLDAEMREYYRMLGAQLAEQPRSRGAAATAHAMGDPVLAPAADLLPEARMREAVATAKLVGDGLCAGLVSNGLAPTMSAAVWAMSGNAPAELARNWRLISQTPAEVMGLSDRGVLEHGKRADLVIVNAASRNIEATITKGRLVFLRGEVEERLFASGQPVRIMAQ